MVNKRNSEKQEKTEVKESVKNTENNEKKITDIENQENIRKDIERGKESNKKQKKQAKSDSDKKMKKESKSKKTDKKSKNKEVCEVFNVDGSQIKTCGKEKLSEEELKNQKQKEKKIKKKEKKQLKWTLIIMGWLIFIVFLSFFIYYQINKFEYIGMDWEKISYGELILYNSKIPIYSDQGVHVADYNFFFRNDPRKLRNIPINGTIRLDKKRFVFSSDPSHVCPETGIAITPIIRYLNQIKDINVEANENASCKKAYNYVYVRIEKGNETKIEQIPNPSHNCYTIYVKDCEMVKVMERFTIGILAHSKGIYDV